MSAIAIGQIFRTKPNPKLVANTANLAPKCAQLPSASSHTAASGRKYVSTEPGLRQRVAVGLGMMTIAVDSRGSVSRLRSASAHSTAGFHQLESLGAVGWAKSLACKDRRTQHRQRF